MKFFSPFCLICLTSLILFFSCTKHTNLIKEFSCKGGNQLQQLEEVSDFNNNFTVKIPKYWNTKLYYDTTQSEIFSADTIKNLTDSYIMDFAMVLSSINISNELQNEVRQKSKENAMETIKESFHTFKGYDAFAYIGNGKDKGYDLNVFQYYFKIDEEKYMRIKTEFYGNENFEARLCEALSLIEKIEIH